VGRGLLTSDGDFWRRQRKLAQPAFHHHRVRVYADTMVGHTERAMERFRDGETRDIHDDMMRLTLDIVAETLFGADVGGAAERIGNALEVLMERFAGYGVLVPPWIPTPGNVRIKRAIRDMDDVYGIIRNRRSGADRGDLLSMLLAATTDEGGGMSDQQLRDEVVPFCWLATKPRRALTFTFHLLAGTPRVYDELRAEVSRTLNGRPATFADLPNLPHADAVVRETLRLYPPGRGPSVAKRRSRAGSPVWIFPPAIRSGSRSGSCTVTRAGSRNRTHSNPNGGATTPPNSSRVRPIFRSVEALASASATPSR
jgi:cytochrome P450